MLLTTLNVVIKPTLQYGTTLNEALIHALFNVRHALIEHKSIHEVLFRGHMPVLL